MFKCVLFDFDGTVFDTVEGITKSIRYAINKHGMDAPLDELRCFAGPPLVEKFMEVYSVSEDQAKQLVADFRERYKPIGLYECRVFPGIKELLERLKKAGVKTGITTMKPQEHALMLLERENMLGLFDVIYGSSFAQTESKQLLVERAIESLGASKADAVLVGDTKYDIHGAHGCGVKAVGVRYGYAANGELEKAGADWIVEDMAELEAFLLS